MAAFGRARSQVRYAVSTHLYHEARLAPVHLAEISAHGFDAIELFATRTHVDYHDPRAAAELARWLADARLEVHSMHAPIVEGIHEGRWGAPLSLAAADARVREHALAETAAALGLARHIPMRLVVVHLGVGADAEGASLLNSRDAARRSLEKVAALAEAAGVRIAIEVIPNELSDAAALVRLIEDELELPDVGICLDFGHAQLMGDLVEAIEVASGLLVTTHVHDTLGTADDHLAPFEGIIDWEAALTAVQKVGYDGPLVFEMAGTGSTAAVLERAREARRRFDAILEAGIR